MRGFSHLGVKNLYTKTTRRILVFTSAETNHITLREENHCLDVVGCMVLGSSLVDPELDEVLGDDNNISVLKKKLERVLMSLIMLRVSFVG